MTLVDYTAFFQTSDRVLWVQREQLLYNVTDQYGCLIFYSPSLDTAERFMRAYVAKNPGSSLDVDALEIARGAQLHRETLARALTRSGGPVGNGPVPPDDFSRAVLADVIPFPNRKEVA